MDGDNDALDAIRAFLTDPSDTNAEAVRPHVDEGLEIAVHTTNETGAEAGIAALQESLFKNVVHGGKWEKAETEGEVTTQVLTMPAQAIAAGCTFRFIAGDSGRIEGGWILPPATLDPAAVELTEAIRARIDRAEQDHMPVLFAFLSSEGQPEQIYRSSVRTHGPDQLAFWNPRSDDAFINAIAANPTVNAIYRHSGTHEMLELSGRARIIADGTEAAQIREAGAEQAKAVDPDGKGVAVVVDLDRVNGLIHAADTL